MGVAAHAHRLLEVAGRQRRDGGEEPRPAVLPRAHDRRSSKLSNSRWPPTTTAGLGAGNGSSRGSLLGTPTVATTRLCLCAPHARKRRSPTWLRPSSSGRSPNSVWANKDFGRDAQPPVQFSNHVNRQRSTPIQYFSHSRSTTKIRLQITLRETSALHVVEQRLDWIRRFRPQGARRAARPLARVRRRGLPDYGTRTCLASSPIGHRPSPRGSRR